MCSCWRPESSALVYRCENRSASWFAGLDQGHRSHTFRRAVRRDTGAPRRMARNDQGITAVIETEDAHTIVLTSRRVPPVSLEQLLSLGIHPEQKSIVIAKGVVAPRAAYEPIAGEIILVGHAGCHRQQSSPLRLRQSTGPLVPARRGGGLLTAYFATPTLPRRVSRFDAQDFERGEAASLHVGSAWRGSLLGHPRYFPARIATRQNTSDYGRCSRGRVRRRSRDI